MNRAIKAGAVGQAAGLREQSIAMNKGQDPERFLIADAEVRSAGDIPVAIIKHESQYAALPEYEPALERMWSEGQEQWRALSGRSTLATAGGSGHYIHVDRPDPALKAVKDVTAQVRGWRGVPAGRPGAVCEYSPTGPVGAAFFRPSGEAGVLLS